MTRFRADCLTKDGRFCCEFTQLGLVRIGFPSKDPSNSPPIQFDSEPIPGLFPVDIPTAWIEQTHRAVHDCLEGARLGELPPYDLQGSEFQQRVWNALCAIPLGETRSYGEIADGIGNPGAVRAVGRACGANPLPLLIPCHRVLAADGKLGGFSGGMGWKPLLLAREGWSSGRDLPLFHNRNEPDSS